MKKSIIDSYSDVAFSEIVKLSTSYRDCAKRLGYFAYGNVVLTPIRERVEKLDIDTSHFYTTKPTKRTEENVFCENSTASSKVLRKWYKKGEYTPYECAICSKQPFWMGKPLTLILDHINGYNKDNRLENLRWVCPDCNSQLETTNAKNINHGIRVHYYCVDCGRELSNKNSERCKNCNDKYLHELHIVNKEKGIYSFPNSNKLVYRDELKELIRTKPFTYVGEYYGVTDNAVRKWCKRINLPSKSTEIKQISDEDWEKI